MKKNMKKGGFSASEVHPEEEYNKRTPLRKPNSSSSCSSLKALLALHPSSFASR